MTGTLPTRAEIPINRTWDRSVIFTDDAAWENALIELTNQLPTVTDLKDKLGDSAENLLAGLVAMGLLRQRAMHLMVYAHMGYYVDTSNQTEAAKIGKAQAVIARIQSAIAFFEPELLTISPDTIATWIADNEPLAVYAHYLEKLQTRAKHVRSAEVEALLGDLGDVIGTALQTPQMLTNTDMQFPDAISNDNAPFNVEQSTIGGMMNHTDREIRRTAYESYADQYLAFKNTLANGYNASVKNDVFRARTRNYDSSLHASLSAYHVPLEVYHNTIATFKKNLPVWHRYWRIRRKALGVETLYEYDVLAPLTTNKPHVSYEQAVEWIAQGMQPLGAAYANQLRKGCLEDRWVDVYPNKGKGAGAFSTGHAGTHPYIFMSHEDDLFSLSTLAHELGHSMHSYYSWQNQPLVYSSYSLFVAEVASNFNQALTRAYLFDTQPDPNFQLALIDEAMSNFHRYFFIMPTLARFELEVHELSEQGQPLTADMLNNLMADLFAEGYGDEVEIDRDRTGITWAQFGHLYSNYYTYQYTTGISAAHALAEPILAGDKAAAQRYLEFLSAGGSQYPLDVLRHAGVDMLSPEPVEKTFAVLGEIVDRLEGLVEG
jgi:oligoendopeptidase F